MAKKRNEKLKKKENEKEAQQAATSTTPAEKKLTKFVEKRTKDMEGLVNVMNRDMPQVNEKPSLATGSRRSTRVRYQVTDPNNSQGAAAKASSVERPEAEKRRKD